MIEVIKNLKLLYLNSVGYNKQQVFERIISSDDAEALKFLYLNSVGYNKQQVFERIISSDDAEALKLLYLNSVGYNKQRVFERLISSDNPPVLKTLNQKSKNHNKKKVIKTNQDYSYDFFICHASEDKTAIARPLAIELEKKNFKVWYDELTLTLGDSLRRSIDKGLSTSQYGIIILSHSFFKKEWPQKELDALVAREDGKDKVILPIWHNIGKEDIMRYSPLLSDKLAVSSIKGINFIVEEITKACSDLY